MHEAIIAKIDKVEEIPGAKTIQIGYVLGETVVVGKDQQPGDIGIYFPCDLQLSDDYVKYNNLYRHSEKNIDPNKTGFFDDNRKVRAQKFMKVRSDGYFASVGSLRYLLSDNHISLSVGDKFTHLYEQEICRKFVHEFTKKEPGQKKKKVKLEAPLFHQHVDTEQFKYYIHTIPVGALISFHHKIHGSSGRYSHTLVKRPATTFLQKLKKVFGLYKEENWEYVAGTRRVLLRSDDREKNGFHGKEEWRFEWLDKLKPYLDKGVTVYGEIVGYANGSPIMGRHDVDLLKDKKYTDKYGNNIIYKYCCPLGTTRFVIYRVTYTTPDGLELDMTVDQMRHWCEKRQLECTLQVAPPLLYCGDQEGLLQLVNGLTERPECLTEDYQDPSHVNEGIVIRVDHKDTTPKFYKNKSWAFKCMEGIWREQNEDPEDLS